MAKVRVYYDPKGNTLNVWFDDPAKEATAEETGEEVILVKDKEGHVIGFERLNFRPGPFEASENQIEVLVSQK